ncbi:MAG: hypothetical protein M3167_18550 [Acidobacteriota bacterium]|nr:hypothetical protein [Acidobacteriota bacterium]
MRRGSVIGAGFSALRRWRLVLLLTATAAVLGGAAASPLGPVMRDEIAGRLAGDHLLRNDPAKAPVDVFDFSREKSSAISGWRSATVWMALAGLLFHAFYAGGIVETLGRSGAAPAEFWSASRRNFAHNAKCFALGAIFAAILLGIWLGAMGAAGKSLFENAAPHTAGRAVWTTVTLLVGALLFAAVALLATLAKAARRGSPAIGAWRGFRDARRRLRGRWLQGLGILLFWSVAGAAALAVVFSAAWAQHTPSGPSVAFNLLLLALSLAAIPAAKVGAWGSLLELFDRTEEENREAMREAAVPPVPVNPRGWPEEMGTSPSPNLSPAPGGEE